MKKNHLFVLIVLLASVSIATETEAATSSKTVSTTPSVTKEQVEKRVREFFKDTPVMIEIARCESNFRQFTDAGNVLRGGDSGGMVGVFQFFESIHATPAKALGFDITTLEGNLGYAKYVYKNESTTPWNPAKDCWGVAPAKAVMKNVDKEKLQQQITLLMKLITLLQKQLDAQKSHSR